MEVKDTNISEYNIFLNKYIEIKHKESTGRVYSSYGRLVKIGKDGLLLMFKGKPKLISKKSIDIIRTLDDFKGDSRDFIGD